MYFYSNSWRFTKLTLCPDEYSHFWDYHFILQIRSLFASKSSSDFIFVMDQFVKVLYFFSSRGKHSYRLQFCVSQNHRITECSGLEGISVGHLVQPLCRSKVTYSRLHRTLSRRVLNISREGESTTSLGRLLQCSIISSPTTLGYCHK